MSFLFFEEVMKDAPIGAKTGGAKLKDSNPGFIIDLAKDNDPDARAAISAFFGLLGKTVGAHVSAHVARGGAYIGGGMISRFHEAFAESDPEFWGELTGILREESKDCGPGKLSDSVQLILVTNENCGLPGLHNCFAFSKSPEPKPEPSFRYGT